MHRIRLKSLPSLRKGLRPYKFPQIRCKLITDIVKPLQSTMKIFEILQIIWRLGNHLVVWYNYASIQYSQHCSPWVFLIFNISFKKSFTTEGYLSNICLRDAQFVGETWSRTWRAFMTQKVIRVSRKVEWLRRKDIIFIEIRRDFSLPVNTIMKRHYELPTRQDNCFRFSSDRWVKLTRMLKVAAAEVF